MKRFLLVLFLPMSVFAQNNMTHTHQAVFFDDKSSKQEQLELLVKKYGFSTNDLTEFHSKPVVFVEGNETLQQLLNEPTVNYISPVLMNSKFEFATFCPNFFVKVKSLQDFDLVKAEAEKLGLEIVGANQFNKDIIELKTNKHGIDVREAISHFIKIDLFEIVSPNLMHTVSDCTVDDPRFNRQWHLKNEGTPVQGNGTPGADIDAEAAWAITTGSSNVKIAIIDSGVDTLHPELLGKLLPGFDAFEAGTNGYPIPNFENDGHGTSCAGIAAANTNNNLGVAGVCPDCSVIPIRVFEYVDLGSIQPWSTTEVFMNGLSWAWQEGNADVASNSWGVPDDILSLFPAGDPLLINAIIDDAIEQGRGGFGVPMLFSSGNDGVTDTIPIWPARYESTIAVGATSMCDEHKSQSSCDGESWWAGNWGEGLDVSAPGVRVATIDMLGGNGFHSSEYYNSFNGTSAACPNAAGVVALMLSHTPGLPEWFTRKALAKTCEKVGGYDYSTWKWAGNWSYELGYGRVNALEAVTYGASSVDENAVKLGATVETHPTQHIIRFEETKMREWQLIDINGRLVTNDVSSDSITIQHSGLSKGIYALRIATGENLNTIKLIVP